jgi:serine/threonine-protein kinase
MLVVAVVAAAALALVLYFYINKSVEDQVTIPERKMIVVLPFKNLGSPADDYFAEGVRDEISNKLSSLSSLGVISRNSAEKFADSNKSSKEIGKELGVDYILEGTIRWAKGEDKENRVRIIPQLVRVSDDINIWSDAFDRTINDIFNVQNEIAQNVVNKLGIKVPLGRSITGPPPTKNLEAYDYYLKALKFHYGPSTGANIKTCVKLYEQAIKLDSNFAAAYAQVSIAYMGLYKLYWDRDTLNLKKASLYLTKAKMINSDIADVHLAQFFYHYWYTGDEERVLKELKKVIEIQPNNAEAHFMISGVYWRSGDVALSEENDIKAMQLDPLNARYPWGMAVEYNLKRDFEKADKYFQQAIKLSSNSMSFYAERLMNYIDWKGDTRAARQITREIIDDEYLEEFFNVFIYLDILDRNYENAIKELKSSKREYENSYNRYIPNSQMLAFVYKYMNNEDEARKYFKSSEVKLENMLSSAPDDNRLRFALSLSYAGLGHKDKAISELETAFKSDPSRIGRRIKYARMTYLSTIFILTGDYNNALKQIDQLLSNPTGFSVNRLILDPLYDPLRNLQAYKEIIQKYSGDN